MLDNIDKYITEMLAVKQVPEQFMPHIKPVYPPNNYTIFEEWFYENYTGCNTDRVYLPIFFTSYWVNNNYGNDQQATDELLQFISTLDNKRKYFTIIQYDDGSMIDWSVYGLDVLEFNMSKQNGVMLPLICNPHPYKFSGPNKWFANFVGSKTHPIRQSAELLKSQTGYYISFENHNIESYCKIIYESMFTLCYRGYGANSFRTTEALQYGSIPVYISDKFILPFGINFNDFGVLIKMGDADNITEILESIEPDEVIEKQNRIKQIYNKYYTYEGCFNQIISHLEAEYNNGQQG